VLPGGFSYGDYLRPGAIAARAPIMAGHAQAIERRLRPLVENLPFALMSPPPPRYPQNFFAADSFHPSAQGYSLWAEFALRDAESRGALDHFRSR